eukprot:7978222-Pyramimonas_sp.AAC.1
MESSPDGHNAEQLRAGQSKAIAAHCDAEQSQRGAEESRTTPRGGTWATAEGTRARRGTGLG